MLAPALALAGWLLVLHGLSYASGSFELGLGVGTALPGALGTGLWIRRRWAKAGSASAPPLRSEKDDRRDLVWMLASASLATLLISPLAFGWAFHDEIFIQGHQSIASQIQNGHYPPRNISFPEMELRYHYGFNVVSAAVGAIARVPIPVAIDGVTCAGWFLCWCLLWVLGRRLTGSRLGALAAPLVLFAGGLPALCDAPVEGCPSCPGVSICPVEGWAINPPIVSYFFQHPWTLGLPLALALLLVFDAALERPRARHAVVGAALLLALAWSQFVLFLCVAGALWGAACLVPGPGRARRAGVASAVVGCVLSVASVSGAWFAGGTSDGLGVVFYPGVTGSLVGTLRWLLASHGALLFAGVAGLFLLRRGRVPLALLVIGSLACLNLANHVYTWDIVKFGTVAQLALALSATALLVRLVESGRERWRPLAAGAVMLACVGAGLNFVVAVPRTPEAYLASRSQSLDLDDAATVSWLRAHVEAGEVTLRMALDPAIGYAQWGGLPQVWMDGVLSRVRAFGPSTERIGRRQKLLMLWPEAAEPWLEEGVRWLVVAPEDERLAARVEGWLSQGRARDRARFGRLRIVELLD